MIWYRFTVGCYFNRDKQLNTKYSPTTVKIQPNQEYFRDKTHNNGAAEDKLDRMLFKMNDDIS